MCVQCHPSIPCSPSSSSSSLLRSRECRTNDFLMFRSGPAVPRDWTGGAEGVQVLRPPRRLGTRSARRAGARHETRAVQNLRDTVSALFTRPSATAALTSMCVVTGVVVAVVCRVEDIAANFDVMMISRFPDSLKAHVFKESKRVIHSRVPTVPWITGECRVLSAALTAHSLTPIADLSDSRQKSFTRKQRTSLFPEGQS